MSPKEVLEAWRRLPPDVQAQLKAAAQSQPGDQEAILQALIKQYMLTRTPAGVVVSVMDKVGDLKLKEGARVAGRFTGRLLRRIRGDD